MEVEAEIQEPKRTGRPSEFSIEVMTEICERIAEGESLTQVCQSNPDFPSRRTILRWVKNDDAAKKVYDAAQVERMHFFCDEILRIANDTSNDTIIDKDGRESCNHEWIRRSEVRIRALQWTMGRMAPKIYGDKLPEAIAAREMEANPDPSKIEVVTGVPRIEFSWKRTIVDPIHDDWGSPISGEDALRKRIFELEERLGTREGKPLPPKLLPFDPGPIPKRMGDEVRDRFLRAIKDNVPDADQREPESVLDEVLTEFENALKAKYAPDAAA